MNQPSASMNVEAIRPPVGTPPSEPRPMQDRAVRTRATILEAAADVFDAAGYASATIEDIASRAGVAKGALYFHFRSKGLLAAAVVAQHHADWSALAAAAVADSPNALAGIDAMVASVSRLYLVSAVTRAGTRLENEYLDIEAQVAEPFVGWIGRLTELLRVGKQDGSVGADVACPAVARVMVGSFYGIQAVSARLHDRQDLTCRVEEWWTLFRPMIASST